VSALGSPTKSSQALFSSPITVRDFGKETIVSNDNEVNEIDTLVEQDGVDTTLEDITPSSPLSDRDKDERNAGVAQSADDLQVSLDLQSHMPQDNDQDDVSSPFSETDNEDENDGPAVRDVTEGDSTFNRWLEGDSGYTDVETETFIHGLFDPNFVQVHRFDDFSSCEYRPLRSR
jgi:hypothetical protein